MTLDWAEVPIPQGVSYELDGWEVRRARLLFEHSVSKTWITLVASLSEDGAVWYIIAQDENGYSKNTLVWKNAGYGVTLDQMMESAESWLWD